MIDALGSKLGALTAASLTDACGRLFRHRMHILGLVSPTPGRVLFGRAATIRYMPYRQDFAEAEKPGFARFFYEAIADASEETVLVLDNPGLPDTSIGGGVKFSRLHNHGVAGLITDGRLRDFAELATYGPAFYCGGEAVQAGSETLMPVAANVPVSLRGTTIFPGDYIYANAVAAIVIPAASIDRVIELASEIEQEDKAFVEAIRAEDPRTILRRGSEER
ncbi:RraA family protein [Sphingomonas sp. PR090111-T3T-6A]|uniref:RraA family protein n=1 Tax=Sphingomonas sp. PR090111-T3T-6A TaxID=685778 RepID=UPI000365F06B|nr:RraA family protein [Sphingomonas sp. PR090111-T3T-6A]